MRNKIFSRGRKKIGIKISKAESGDIDDVYRIEQEQFLKPWKKHYFTAELSHDLSYFYIARDEDAGDIRGYMICWIIEKTMEIHNIAVKREHKRQGTGSQLMEFMLAKAAADNVDEVFLEVRKSNLEAVRFYEKYKFRQIGCRKNYFSEPQEDALVYALYL